MNTTKLLSRAAVLTTALALTSTGAAAQGKDSADVVSPYDTFNKYRVGGYGEMVAAWKDYGTNRFFGGQYGNSKESRSTISIPRFVVAMDYKLSSQWILGAEIEFESGGTGSAYELENTENGEYETELEKGGEVAIEQFHITRLITRSLNIRAGHMIVPVGLTNAHHEPNLFFGTVRPEGETTLLPSTWHETGLELFGTVGKGLATFDYEAMVVAGLNANGFDRNQWAGGASQGIFEEDNFTSPAYVVRLDWRGIKGLRLGGSFYFCNNIGANSDKKQTYDGLGKIPLRIWTIDGQYSNRYVTARANVLLGNLGNTEAVNSRNGKLSNNSPYSRLTPVAKRAVSYAGEVGVNLRSLLGIEKMPVIIPFARYEYYNPQEKVVGNYSADNRLQTSIWVAGVNWRPLPNLIVKADYTTRQIGTSQVFGKGTYNSENEFAVGVAFVGWFVKK
ncbi:MAG: hypothetical protein ACI3YZ_07360 [Prevotella sp.]